MSDEAVQFMSHVIGVAPFTFLIANFFERTVDETVFGIHDGRLRIGLRLFFNTFAGIVAVLQDLLLVG